MEGHGIIQFVIKHGAVMLIGIPRILILPTLMLVMKKDVNGMKQYQESFKIIMKQTYLMLFQYINIMGLLI